MLNTIEDSDMRERLEVAVAFLADYNFQLLVNPVVANLRRDKLLDEF